MLCMSYQRKLLGAAEEWYVSEKYDGWRLLRKNGKFIGRSGKPIDVPEYIRESVAFLPEDMVLDGELWLGYGEFENIATAVATKSPGLQWLLFDAPSIPGNYSYRWKELSRMVGEGNSVVRLVKQYQAKTEKEVDEIYQKITGHEKQVEGIVLRPATMGYTWGDRDRLFMKRKPIQDMEVTVIEHYTTPGTQHLQGYVSSLVCEYDNIQFHVPVKTVNPPSVGSTITIYYQGMTLRGVPKFARCKAVRDPMDLPKPHVHIAKKPLPQNGNGIQMYTMDELAKMNGVELLPGQKVLVQSSKNSGCWMVTQPKNPAAFPYCNCPAWKYQSKPPSQRVCKHTLSVCPELLI